MAKTVKKLPDSILISRPGLTPEAEDNELIALAIRQAKQQLKDGTASSQLVHHFVQRGSPKARLEQKKLEREIALIDAKIESLKQADHMEELYNNAINALKEYSGRDVEYEDE